jgi:hypothetical protein
VSASSVLLSVRGDRITEQLGEDKFSEQIHLPGSTVSSLPAL